jgi:hypothetical protein
LIVHTLSVSQNSLVVAIFEVALTTPDHNRYLSQLNLARCKSFDQSSFSSTNTLSFLDVHIDFGVDLVSKVSDSRLVRKVGVNNVVVPIAHHGLVAGVNLTKLDDIADILVLFFDAWKILLVYKNDVLLVFLYNVRDHNLDKSVVRFNLLINHTVLLEIRINDLPLIVNIDLFFSIIFYIWLRIILALSLSIQHMGRLT